MWLEYKNYVRGGQSLLTGTIGQVISLHFIQVLFKAVRVIQQKYLTLILPTVW